MTGWADSLVVILETTYITVLKKTWLLQCTSGHVYMTTIIRLLYNNDTNLIWCVYMHFVFVFLIKHPVNMTSLTMTSLSVRAVLMCHLLVCKTCKVTFSFSTRSHCNKIHLLLHFYTFADVKRTKETGLTIHTPNKIEHCTSYYNE